MCLPPNATRTPAFSILVLRQLLPSASEKGGPRQVKLPILGQYGQFHLTSATQGQGGAGAEQEVQSETSSHVPWGKPGKAWCLYE